MSTVWLFLNTRSVGGAEKRFIGLWQSLVEEGNYNLVITRELYDQLKTDRDLGNGLMTKQNNIFFFEYAPRKFNEVRTLYKNFIQKFTALGDLLHFVGTHPLLPGIKQRHVFSVTTTSLKYYNLFGKLIPYLGLLVSNKLDILDPKMYSSFSKWLWFKKKDILLTSNSFCNTDIFISIDFKEKKDWLVFLGRFEKVKQVKELLEAVPLLYQEIKEIAKNDLHFYFLGKGSLDYEIKELVKQPSFNNVPITIEYNRKPEEILAQSKIFFSVQLFNNYPSRSLIEAMASGNIPIVTDAGDTKQLAKPAFSYYVPEHFEIEDIVNAVKKLYGEDVSTLERKSKLARQVVIDEHRFERMRDYYLDIYQQLRSKTNGADN